MTLRHDAARSCYSRADTRVAPASTRAAAREDAGRRRRATSAAARPSRASIDARWTSERGRATPRGDPPPIVARRRTRDRARRRVERDRAADQNSPAPGTRCARAVWRDGRGAASAMSATRAVYALLPRPVPLDDRRRESSPGFFGGSEAEKKTLERRDPIGRSDCARSARHGRAHGDAHGQSRRGNGRSEQESGQLRRAAAAARPFSCCTRSSRSSISYEESYVSVDVGIQDISGLGTGDALCDARLSALMIAYGGANLESVIVRSYILYTYAGTAPDAAVARVRDRGSVLGSRHMDLVHRRRRRGRRRSWPLRDARSRDRVAGHRPPHVRVSISRQAEEGPRGGHIGAHDAHLHAILGREQVARARPMGRSAARATGPVQNVEGPATRRGAAARCRKYSGSTRRTLREEVALRAREAVVAEQDQASVTSASRARSSRRSERWTRI